MRKLKRTYTATTSSNQSQKTRCHAKKKVKRTDDITTSSNQRHKKYYKPRYQPPRKVKRTDNIETISYRRQKTHYHAKRKRNLHLDDTNDEEAHSSASFSSRALSDELASNLSSSVVSLASFDGDKMHFACTGIMFEISSDYALIMTSARLFDKEDIGPVEPIYYLKIKVRLPNNQVVPGVLHEYFPEDHLAFVCVDFPLGLCAAHLYRSVLLHPLNDWLFSVSCCFNSGNLVVTSGVLVDRNLTATGGVLIDSPSEAFTKEIMFSSCKITEAGTGGPLVDLHGNIVGVNLYYARGMTPFIPTNQILQFLVKVGTIIPRSYYHSSESNQGSCYTGEGTTNRTQDSSTTYICSPKASEGPEPFGGPSSLQPHCPRGESDELCEDDQPSFRPLCWSVYHWVHDGINRPVLRPYLQIWEFNAKKAEDLRSKGYPLPVHDDEGMHLRCTFEEQFGQNMWSKATKKPALKIPLDIVSKISRDIVSLASFHGTERFFVCTGVFINGYGCTTSVLTSASLVRTSGDENKIDHNLRIEVCLPSKQRVIGTLEHCNLHYNVAVINIMDIRSHRSALSIMGILHEAPQSEVVALGRGFESGVLMATNGVVTYKTSRFDCKELKVSTCKISKAGIGGPLVDIDGNFVGMNFYDMDETPFLPRDMILDLLRRFDAKRATADADGIMGKCIYRWPVPDPYWYYPRLHTPYTQDEGYKFILD